MQLNEADTIKVAVRVRPLNNLELEKGASPVLQVAEDNSYIKVGNTRSCHGRRSLVAPLHAITSINRQVVVPGPAGNKMQRDFAFHACLGPGVNQSDVMHMCGIPQLLDAALSGYNVTIFAYGQTGRA
jgi:hypothetical protein